MTPAALGLIEDCLEHLWNAGGTDLLITAGAPPILRVDGLIGAMEGRPVLGPPETGELVRRLAGAQLAGEFDARRQIDFAFTWKDRARLRVNAFMQRGAAALAFRMIPLAIPTLSELGLPAIVERWARLPRGFVLVTGPTGSGKSTTLASMIDHINAHRALHIVTIEDPIEYVHRHKRGVVSQREVGTDTHSFADALRAVLREDPDVVLIGEMRDPESIQAALTIAETGHLVFSTLHTNDPAQTLDRIIDVFPTAQQPQVRLQLTHTLAGVLHQLLVRRVGGGRVAAFDVMNATEAVRNLIREGKTRQIRNVIVTGQRDGMQTLETSLSDLVAGGVVEYEEAILCSLHPGEIQKPAAPGAGEAPRRERRR